MTTAIPLTGRAQIAAGHRAASLMGSRLGFQEADMRRLHEVLSALAERILLISSLNQLFIDEAEDGDAVDALIVARGGIAPSAAEESCEADVADVIQGLRLACCQSDLFDMHLEPGAGVAILARVRRRGAEAVGEDRYGALCVARLGQAVCGDVWCVRPRPDGIAILVADGAGHGARAALASSEALRLFLAAGLQGPAEVAQRLHQGLRHTCGGAIGVALLSPGIVRYTGIGSVGGVVIHQRSAVRMESMGGTAGRSAPAIRERRYDASVSGLVVLHSDGIAASWDIGRYCGLMDRHPRLIAAVIYRDFARGRNDVAIVVAPIRR